MNPNRQEFHANMRGCPSPLQEPHGWEPDPRPVHLHQAGNGSYSQKSDGKSRVRGASNGLESPPTPEYIHRNLSYPPGFADSHRNQMGYENSHSEMHFQECLEITSDRPFFPQRRTCSEGRHVSEDQIRRVHKQGTMGELCGSSRSLPKHVRGRDFEAPYGDLTETFPSKMRKKAKFSPATSMNSQAVDADTFVSLSSFEEELPRHMLGKPPVPRSGVATDQKSSTNSFERATKECQKLWEALKSAILQRESVLRQKEQDFTQSSINKEALEEEKKQAATTKTALEEEKKQAATMKTALEEEKKQATITKNEIMEERRKLEEEAQRIREDKDAMERTSTEIALQMVELKQVQKQIEKEKATLLALKADSSSNGRNLQEQDCGGVAVTAPLGTVKAEIGEPVTIPCRNCKSRTRESDARPSNIQDQEPKMGRNLPSVSKFLPGVSNRNFESVKVDFVTSGSDAAHRDESTLDGNASEDSMDDLPLAYRLKPQRVERRRENRRVGEKTMQQDSNMESSRRRKSVPHDTYMKSNKVAIEVALQEDAPGLLEQLEEKELLEDMRVYQDMGSDDLRSSDSPEIEFGQLEGVVGKLWGAGTGLGKDLMPIKGQAQGSGNMPRYCLACLLSLIEQTKLLRKRNWPVDWGWCRRLRAFVFVFEKHNRVVIERPEYGYATYFFELVQRLPVKWQVQRLITVMSVASTGRAALLENRQLLVGTDLSVEDAAVLEDYGWNRNSGLGSLLNFCDRVVHDYNKGQDPAELGNDWKQKIGKLLMDGYDQGSILTTSIPKKLERLLGTNWSDVDLCPGLNVKADPL